MCPHNKDLNELQRSKVMTKPIVYYSAHRLTHGYTDVGGWADRLKGMLFCKIIALIWGGELKIIWPSNEPFPLKLREHKLIKRIPDPPHSFRYDLIDAKTAEHLRRVSDLIALKPKSGKFYINANSMHFMLLEGYKNDLLKLFNIRKWTEANIFKTIYETLFEDEIGALSTNEYANFVKFRDLSKPLIGAHMRCGGWGNWSDPILDLPRNGSVLAKAVKSYAVEKGIKEYQVYLAADNVSAKEFFLKAFGDDRGVFTQQSLPVHIDRSIEKSTNHFENVFVDHYCLSLCNAVVHGSGDFAKTAAMIHGAEYLRYEDLECAPFVNRLLTFWRKLLLT